NSGQRDKLVSAVAVNKSKVNGFPSDQHYGAVAKIAALWKHATLVEERKDTKHQQADVTILRFAAPLLFEGEQAIAYLTVKETGGVGHRVYSLELMEIETLRRKVDVDTSEEAPHTPARSVEGDIDRLFDKINPDFISKTIDENGEPIAFADMLASRADEAELDLNSRAEEDSDATAAELAELRRRGGARQRLLVAPLQGAGRGESLSGSFATLHCRLFTLSPFGGGRV
ncbi:MAG: hypothetical protein LBS59_09635, partial [Puniceicoccales bacterium]|nr:hypothetical protein [Puniceicoccales bacterium]